MPVLPRRQLLSVGSLGALSLPTLLQACAAKAEASTVLSKAKSCVLLYMDGGPSHIDLLDMKPQAPAEIRGPYAPIATSVPGILVSELMPRVAQQMHHLLQIRSVQHDQMVHDPAVYQMLTGYPHISSAGGLKVEATDLPHIGCAFSQADRVPTSLPRHIQLPDVMTMEARVLPGQNGGVLGPSSDPFAVNISPAGEITRPPFARQAEISLRRQAARADLLKHVGIEHQVSRAANRERFDDFQRQAFDILSREAVDRAFDVHTESSATQDRFGRHRHGRSVLLARRLVEAGARFVTVYWGNEEQDWADGRGPKLANNPWDTHRNHFPLMQDSLLPRADQTLAAFIADLDERGLLDETLVVWMGDFGRTPRISKPWASRDHWPHAFTILMAGAGLRRGTVIGATDSQAAYVADSPVSPADVTATICAALGVDPAQNLLRADGLPHRISTGRVLSQLW